MSHKAGPVRRAASVLSSPAADAHAERTLDQLHEILASRRREVSVGTLPETAKALRWLGRCQRADGFWSEEDDEGTTALCVLAVAGWRSAPGDADESRAAAESVDLDRTADWLEARARKGFSTPWYRAVNLSALCALGRGHSRSAEALKKELVRLDPDSEQAWLNRGHHAAQILGALARCGEDRDVLHSWREAVRRELSSDNDMYVTGQMAQALFDAGVPASDLDDTVHQLCGHLRSQPLSKQSFLGYVPALLALSVVSSAEPEVAQLVREKTSELVGKYAETAWYNDPEYVAWSLLVLRRSTCQVEIAIDPATVNRAFGKAKGTLADEQRRSRRWVALLSVALVAELLVLAALVVVEPESFLLTTVVVGFVIAPTLFVILRRLWGYLR